MRVVSPIDNLAEAAALLEAGADELYGGLIPAEWQQRFDLVASLNQRTFAEAQIASWDDLAGILDLVHRAGKTFLLTLNAPFYSEAQLPLLLDYVDQAVQRGIDGVILADLGLLRLLRRRHPELQYHASTLAHLGNSAALRFYADQGITGAVLPRHLSVAELTAIVAAVPEVRCDAFLLVGKCPNTEGLCTFHHSSPDKIWPCEIPYQIKPLQFPASPGLEQAMARQNSWSLTNRRHGCGLCAIPGLLAAGLDGLKLVGRGAPTAQKVINILLTRDFLRLASETDDLATYRQKARAAHRRRFGSPCSPNVCYYPEFYQSE
jgi:putative protease